MSASRKTTRSRSKPAPAKPPASSGKPRGRKKAVARPLSKKAERALRSAGAGTEALFNEIVQAIVAVCSPALEAIGKRLDELDRRISELEDARRATALPHLHVGPPLGSGLPSVHIGPPVGSPTMPGDPLVTFEVEIPPPGRDLGSAGNPL